MLEKIVNMLGLGFLRNTFIYRFRKIGKARLAVNIYGDPSREMMVIWVTGTDGKTTTCRMIHHVLQSFGKKAIVMGTTGVIVGDKPLEWVVKMTSYDPMDMQRILSQAKDAGCTYAILEVSSHSLEQERFLGISFSAAVLTNITPEHLDYHKTMENYAHAKKKLFQLVEQNINAEHTIAVLPQDDAIGRQRTEQIHVDRLVDYGMVTPASLSAHTIYEELTQTKAIISYMWQEFPLTLPLVGKFNIANALAALGICIGLELPIEEAVQHLQNMPHIQWRQNMIQQDGVTYIIDFAHTPHGLEVMLQWLKACRENMSEGQHKWRIRCLFGAPGERDRAKRPEMWKIVEEYADMIVLTDDDAAGENRRKILNDVKQWISREQGETFFVIPDRRQAIRFVVDHVQSWDMVLLAWKGHESVLVTNFGKVPWWENEVLLEEISKKKQK